MRIPEKNPEYIFLVLSGGRDDGYEGYSARLFYYFHNNDFTFADREDSGHKGGGDISSSKKIYYDEKLKKLMMREDYRMDSHGELEEIFRLYQWNNEKMKFIRKQEKVINRSYDSEY